MLIGESSLAFNPLGEDNLAERVPLCVIVLTAFAPTVPYSLSIVEITLEALEPLPVVLVPVDAGPTITLGALVPQDEVVSPAVAVIALAGLDPVEIPRYCPQHLFLGYASDGTNISIPIAKLSGLDAAEADTLTGDWREIVQTIFRTAHSYQESFQWSERPRTFTSSEVIWFTGHTTARHDCRAIFITDDSDPPELISEP